MLDYFADKYYDFLHIKGKVNFERGSTEWSDFDYNLRCNLFNYGSLIIMLLLNILTNSWREFLVLVTIFNVLRNFTGGIHAKRLSYCFCFSTCYFMVSSVITHKIIHNDNLILYYSLPFLALIGSIYIYRYIPKVNMNDKYLKLINENNTYNDEEILTIDEKKQAYKWFVGIILLIIVISIFIFHIKFIPITLSMGLISLNVMLSNTGEKIFNYIQEVYLKLIKIK